MEKEIKDNIIKQILSKEWKMFISVQNEGGKSTCQKDQRTFMIMRSSQFQAFSVILLESYLTDLIQAEKQNRNLMTEKYAHMMKYTAPAQYEAMEDLLPEINSTAHRYIKLIIPIFLEWERSFHQTYPYLASNCRPELTIEDKSSSTSFETYLRGELSTYSSRTLRLYSELVKEMYRKNFNLSNQIHLNIVRQYGYESLQAANEFVKRKLLKIN